METEITKLRNLMGPIVAYFDLLELSKNPDIPKSNKSLTETYLEREGQKSIDILPSIVKIIKEIPNNANTKLIIDDAKIIDESYIMGAGNTEGREGFIRGVNYLLNYINDGRN